MSVSVKRIVYALLALIGAAIFLPGLLREDSREYNEEKYVQPNASAIRVALIEDLAQRWDPACVPVPRMPYESALSQENCDRCEALVDAGMLSREVHTVTVAGAPATSARYELTQEAAALYRADLRDRKRRSLPGLCFGETRLADASFSVPGTMSTLTVHVLYRAQVENPHPLLYGPHAGPLGLPALSRGSLDGTRLPSQRCEADLDSRGVFHTLRC